MTIWMPTNLDSDSSKYEAIAVAIDRDIAAGKLKPGQKMPTQRELSQRLGVTIGTIGRRGHSTRASAGSVSGRFARLWAG